MSGQTRLECPECKRLFAWLWRPKRVLLLEQGEEAAPGFDAFVCSNKKCRARFQVERESQQRKAA